VSRGFCLAHLGQKFAQATGVVYLRHQIRVKSRVTIRRGTHAHSSVTGVEFNSALLTHPVAQALPHQTSPEIKPHTL
jgi:hypothetical protein